MLFFELEVGCPPRSDEFAKSKAPDRIFWQSLKYPRGVPVSVSSLDYKSKETITHDLGHFRCNKSDC